MNQPKIHNIDGVGLYKCSKCKATGNHLKGIKIKEGTEKKSPCYKWVCDTCYAQWVSNGGAWVFGY